MVDNVRCVASFRQAHQRLPGPNLDTRFDPLRQRETLRREEDDRRFTASLAALVAVIRTKGKDDDDDCSDTSGREP